MKTLPALLMLALAFLAIPPAQADLDRPASPCWVNQSNDTVCHVEAAGCSVDTYSYDVEDALNHYQAHCLCVHYDNYGRPALRVDCLAPLPIDTAASMSTADPTLAQPCTTGIAQTWCDATAGPCDVRVTPWTAWGDVYAWADCRGGSMTRCYAEVHTQDPLNPEQWCAF